MIINIIVEKEYEEDLRTLLAQNDIEVKKKNLFESDSLKSENEIISIVSILIGTAAFWTALGSVIKELVKKSKIEIEYRNENTGEVYRVHGEKKDLDDAIEKFKLLSKENQDPIKKDDVN